MSWPAFMRARQLLNEERFGALMREAADAEEAAFRQAAQHAPKG